MKVFINLVGYNIGKLLISFKSLFAIIGLELFTVIFYKNMEMDFFNKPQAARA